MKPKIIPAILTDSKADFKDKLEKFKGLTSWLSIDITDGMFVEGVSLQPADLLEFEIPFKIELHLMVDSPQSYFSVGHKLGAKRLIFQIEASSDVRQLITEARMFDFEVGLALNPETELKKIVPFVDDVDTILLLSVKPGRQGQEFISQTIDRIKRLKIIAPRVKIEVDGGINQNNIKEVVAAGADILIVGSAIVGQADFKQAIKNLKDQLK